MYSDPSSSLKRGRVSSFTAVLSVTFLLLIVGVYTDHALVQFTPLHFHKKRLTTAQNKTLSVSHRTLLRYAPRNEKAVEPHRIWSDKCSKSDIVVSQGPTQPLPNGIPTYTVEIMNVCVSGCDISTVHLSCGWFSSARLVNPRVFRRLRFNDCLVNDGKPLLNGRTLSFQYANTFRYPLAVSSVKCL